jgi:hypothetical protein
MKKIYERPVLVKKGNLKSVVAGPLSNQPE